MVAECSEDFCNWHCWVKHVVLLIARVLSVLVFAPSRRDAVNTSDGGIIVTPNARNPMYDHRRSPTN
jgi:hypothetical protein